MKPDEQGRLLVALAFGMFAAILFFIIVEKALG